MELPAGWVWVCLSDVLSQPLINGRSVRSMDDGFPVLRLTSIKSGRIDLDESKEGSWTEEEARPYLVTQGDYLLSRGNGSRKLVGRGGLVGEILSPVAFPDTMVRVRVNSAVMTPKFLRHLWDSPLVRRQIESAARTTAGIYKVNQKILEGVTFPLPPVAEQHRIVEALEGHLSRLDAAEDGIRRAMRRAGSLKRRFLADATDVEGEMSKDVTLGEVSQSVKNGIFVSRPGLEPLGVPILRIGSVRPLKLDASDVRYTGLLAESDALCGALLSEGDILFTRYNGNPEYVGACAVVPAALNDLTYPDKLIRVVVDRSQALPEYVALVCSAGAARDHIRRRVKTTAGQVGISGKEIKAIPFSLPGLEEQAARVQRYREASSAVETLQDVTRRSQVRGRHLRGAILRRAFEGELVPQNPADEPATALLARIQAERAAQPKAKRTRRTPAAPRKAKTAAAPAPAPAPAPTPAPTHAVQQEFDL